ncbi:hypothetical protein F5B18DRAFT_614165 [Nemania serpens]|nr:hypothetical protein F5B18DRAFT_614165 [Nemania serpens]
MKKGGPLRHALMALFTISQIGRGIEKIGVGKRTRSQQSTFDSSPLLSARTLTATQPEPSSAVAAVPNDSDDLFPRKVEE